MANVKYVEWSRPKFYYLGYNKGDIVSYEGKLYRSLVDKNWWFPCALYWEVYEEPYSEIGW